MKFDFAIGNPPYQEDVEGNDRSKPVYNYFIDETYKVADVSELITPARFLFNAGQTPKKWNEKMLNDKHLKVLHYEKDAIKIFPNTLIKGGVVVTLHNNNKDFGEIGEFIINNILRGIVHKVKKNMTDSITKLHYNRSSYRFTEVLYKENLELGGKIKSSERLSIGSNIFDKFSTVFFEEKPNDNENYGMIFGRKDNVRVYKWIKESYIGNHENYNKWKVFVAKSNGTGKFGETLSTLEIAPPKSVSTQTFISFGKFDNKLEAVALSKYLSSKFVRALLGVCKITPDNARKEVWQYIPLQNFTMNSDINWEVSVLNIDRQLYNKYSLSEEELQFIENNVKEME